MPITSIVETHYRAEALDEAIEELRAALVDTRAFDGCLGVDVIQDQGNPARILLIEEWESLDHDRAYRQWRAGAGAVPRLAALREDGRTTHYDQRPDV